MGFYCVARRFFLLLLAGKRPSPSGAASRARQVAAKLTDGGGTNCQTTQKSCLEPQIHLSPFHFFSPKR